MSEKENKKVTEEEAQGLVKEMKKVFKFFL